MEAAHHNLGWAEWKPGAQDSVWICHVLVRDSKLFNRHTLSPKATLAGNQNGTAGREEGSAGGLLIAALNAWPCVYLWGHPHTALTCLFWSIASLHIHRILQGLPQPASNPNLWNNFYSQPLPGTWPQWSNDGEELEHPVCWSLSFCFPLQSWFHCIKQNHWILCKNMFWLSALLCFQGIKKIQGTISNILLPFCYFIWTCSS